ncbi:MAG: 2-amino-4-hydroxy-6-hydroxymethyldihydropteridine diphosphokinase [Methylococcaceae bacterium]
MRCYLGIGSNIEAQKHIPTVLLELSNLFNNISLSSIYQSAPIGTVQGDDFFNLVVGFDSALSASELINLFKQLEITHDRKQYSASKGHTLDLDLLLYGNEIITDLKIPRSDIERYAFVLAPLAEIAPNLMHPMLQVTIQSLWNNFDKTHVAQQIIKPLWLHNESN